MKIRTLLIGLAALLISGCSAYFSIIGLSTLFAGASLVIMIMAGSMEFSKLVTASFLYMYWDKLGKLMKTYLTTALVVLIFITSMGIYGFLTSAFQTTSQELSIINRQIENVEARRDRFQIQIDNDREDRDVLNETITQLTEGLATGNVIQYVDQETGQLVTTTSGNQREILRDQLEQAQEERSELSNRIEAYTDSVTNLDMKILDMNSNTEVAAELGPLQFISEVLNVPMSQVVNLLALLIMFSFDPLAIALVIAFNMSLYFNNEENFDEVLTKPSDDEDDGEDDPTPEPKVEEPKEVEVKEPVLKKSEITEVETIEESEDDDLYAETEPITEEVKKEESPNELDSIEFTNPKPAPVRYEPNGKVVGYDTSGNGLVDKWSHSMYHRDYKDSNPYYAKPNFDWSNTEQWKTDQAAINYWITNIKKSSKYPTDFSSKIY